MPVPADTPVTTAPLTVTLVLPELQVPPVTASLNVIDAASQTVEGPDIMPATGNGLIVTVFSTEVGPQVLVIV